MVRLPWHFKMRKPSSDPLRNLEFGKIRVDAPTWNFLYASESRSNALPPPTRLAQSANPRDRDAQSTSGRREEITERHFPNFSSGADLGSPCSIAAYFLGLVCVPDELPERPLFCTNYLDCNVRVAPTGH